MNYLRFLILSSPRSGTHMLRTALNNHSEIVCHSEMFNPDFIISEDHDLSDSDDEILTQHIFKQYSASVRAVGFILHRSRARFGDWPELWNKLENDRDLKIIFLERKNLLRRHLSHEVMRAKLNNRSMIQSFDPNVLEREFDELSYETEQYIEKFASHSIIRISYEDLCDQFSDTLGKVQTFLGLETQQIETLTEKNTFQPLAQAIKNYDDLKGHFASTHWADFFRDRPVSEDYAITTGNQMTSFAIQPSHPEVTDVSINSETNKVEIAECSANWPGQLRIHGRNNSIRIGRNLSVKKSLVISVIGHNNILEIESDVHFTRRSAIRVVGNNNHIKLERFCSGFYRMIINADSCQILLDENVFSKGLEISSNETNELVIGKDSVIDQDCVISLSPSRAFFERESKTRLNKVHPVQISERVWIGRSVYIHPGTQIGKGSMVDVRSVIEARSSFGERCRIGGYPAKCLQENIYWTRDYFDTLPDELVD